ncbi:hypothetical protein IAD21_00208 [Abditibacteriota bacterium]|nr:hypothetical protein IAD21_00208 [Abditibacteriota bacterium]
METGILSEKVEWQCKRVASAFEVSEWICLEEHSYLALNKEGYIRRANAYAG